MDTLLRGPAIKMAEGRQPSGAKLDRRKRVECGSMRSVASACFRQAPKGTSRAPSGYLRFGDGGHLHIAGVAGSPPCRVTGLEEFDS